MAVQTECQTPEVVFHTHIDNAHKVIDIGLALPFRLNLTPAQAQELEDNIHNALELVLARYFYAQNQ